MGGGSIPNIPSLNDPALLGVLPTMKLFEWPDEAKDQYALAEPGQNYLVYSQGTGPVRLDLTGFPGRFTPQWIDPRTGKTVSIGEPVHGGTRVEFTPGFHPSALWVKSDQP